MLIHQDHDRLMIRHLFFRQADEAGDDDDVAFFGEMGGGAVDTDRRRAPGSGEGVGFEAVAVGDVPDVDVLVGPDIGGFQEVFVDGDAALVMEVRVRHRNSMNFGF